MFQLLETNLFVGGISNKNLYKNKEWAVVHATQTVHYEILGWNRRFNKSLKEHPNYLIYEKNNRLSLNWMDGAAYLYEEGGTATFIKILDFIEQWIKIKKVMVHCDEGISRSPSLCLLYLAKRAHKISKVSFKKAKEDFEKIYPYYCPGGIADYLDQNWDKIN